MIEIEEILDRLVALEKRSKEQDEVLGELVDFAFESEEYQKWSKQKASSKD